MYCIRSFNETQSARGQRPAVCWNQSVLQLQGSRSAAQTTKERWEALLRYTTRVITLPKFLSVLFQAVIGVIGTECYIHFFLFFAREWLALSPSAGDGVLLRVMWDSHVFGVHRGRAQGAHDCSSAGCGGTAQGCAEDTAGCHTQQVGVLIPRESFKQLKHLVQTLGDQCTPCLVCQLFSLCSAAVEYIFTLFHVAGYLS